MRVSWYGGTPPYFLTAAGPALYAATVLVRFPSKAMRSSLMYLIPPSMFSMGSNGSLTRRRFDVNGISCITPLAPLEETALRCPFDSALMMAWTSAGGRSFAREKRSTYPVIQLAPGIADACVRGAAFGPSRR